MELGSLQVRNRSLRRARAPSVLLRPAAVRHGAATQARLRAPHLRQLQSQAVPMVVRRSLHHWSCSIGSPPWCRRRASTATATSACCRERLLTGNFRGDCERQELAVPCRPPAADERRLHRRYPTFKPGGPQYAEQRPLGRIALMPATDPPQPVGDRKSSHSTFGFSRAAQSCANAWNNPEYLITGSPRQRAAAPTAEPRGQAPSPS